MDNAKTGSPGFKTFLKEKDMGDLFQTYPKGEMAKFNIDCCYVIHSSFLFLEIISMFFCQLEKK